MNKLTLSVLLTAFLLVLATTAYALTSSDVQVNQISAYQSDHVVETVVVIENHLGLAKVPDAKVTVTIPELGVRRSIGPFRTPGSGEISRHVFLELDEPLEEEVWVRVVVSTDEGKRVKHRPLFI